VFSSNGQAAEFFEALQDAEYLIVSEELAKRAKQSIIMAHCLLLSARMLVILQEEVFAVIFAASAVGAADFLMWLVQNLD
jgi:hypothetical protein